MLLILSLYSWHYIKKSVHERSELKFESECDRIADLIEDRLALYVNGLYGAQALFASSHSVERNEWHTYVESQHLEERYPGIAALRYVEYVKASDKEAFVESVKKDTSANLSGYPDFTIHPPTEKPEYFASKYVEPYHGNEKMLGLDLGYEPVRMAALEGARDSGEPQATGKITLSGEKSLGFQIFLPVYRNGIPHGTIQEKKEALEGYVDAVFRAADFFSSVFDKEKFPSDIDCEVFGRSFDKRESFVRF